MPTSENTPNPHFRCKGSFITQNTPTQQTKIICSSMRNGEICRVCMGLLYFVLGVCDNKQTHQAAAAEEDAVREQQLKWMQSGCSLV